MVIHSNSHSFAIGVSPSKPYMELSGTFEMDNPLRIGDGPTIFF